MHFTKTEHIVQAFRKKNIARSCEIEAMGISREYLRKLHEQGIVQRIGYGLYSLPDGELTEHRTMAEACKRVPNGVGLPALGFAVSRPDNAVAL